MTAMTGSPFHIYRDNRGRAYGRAVRLGNSAARRRAAGSAPFRRALDERLVFVGEQLGGARAGRLGPQVSDRLDGVRDDQHPVRRLALAGGVGGVEDLDAVGVVD